MSQYDFKNIDPNKTSGTELADHLNQWRDALNSCHRGPKRPGYIQAGMKWIDDSGGSIWKLKLFTGSTDVTISEIDTKNNRAVTPLTMGGTGAISAEQARNNLGLTELATTKKITPQHIALGAVTADAIANEAVSLNKLAPGKADHIIGFDKNGQPSELSPQLGSKKVKNWLKNETSTQLGRSFFYVMKDGSIKGYGINEGVYANVDIYVTYTPNLKSFGGNYLPNPEANIIQIAAGIRFLLVLFDDGTVWAGGDGTNGKRGLGNTESAPFLEKIDFFEKNNLKVIEVFTCGATHEWTQEYSVFRVKTAENKLLVYTCGYIWSGCAGTGQANPFTLLTPTRWGVEDDIVQIAASDNPHARILGLRSNGSIVVCGEGQSGSLGLGDLNDRATPVEVPNIKGAKKVFTTNGRYSSGNNNYYYGFSAFISADDKLYAAGRNIEGQLGVGDYVDKSTFTRCLGSVEGKTIIDVNGIGSIDGGLVALDSTGQVHGTGFNRSGWLCQGHTSKVHKFVAIPGMDNIQKVKLFIPYGTPCLVGLTHDGYIKVSGSNLSKQLGVGNSTNNEQVVKFMITPHPHKKIVDFNMRGWSDGWVLELITEDGTVLHSGWMHGVGCGDVDHNHSTRCVPVEVRF
ncbi:RCC1 domain-containing protein [Zooshikella sp. RANM57]|uniref:RCC1 domain-containing protein n=1 Tax=Zooshikella sp. RANM57 TaxID=3425863 RepID=UPI003D6E6FAD